MAVIRSRRLDLGAETPDAARVKIKALLAEEAEPTRKIYAGLAHKVWSLLVERRLDAEIRDWHGLLQNVKTAIRPRDDAAAERITALIDLLRESISLAESSPVRAVAQRPQAQRILQMLKTAPGFLPRRQLLETLGLGSSHLSNILTQLAAHSLIERQDKGKEAMFKITPLGRELSATATHIEAATKVDLKADFFRKLGAEANHDLPTGAWERALREWRGQGFWTVANDQHFIQAGTRAANHDWNDPAQVPPGTRGRARGRSENPRYSNVHS